MSFERSLTLADEAATAALAVRLAGLARKRDVFAISGPLGSGKTSLARAFVRALTAADEEVPSPTFTLVQAYDSAKGPLFHFDLYRLEAPEQAVELGIDDAFADGICLIEWPERLGRLLPACALRIDLAAGADAEQRIARVSGEDAWARRWG
jgi:tRNA threonylcarbamoyladenosine biosynthesis protein TsaE